MTVLNNCRIFCDQVLIENRLPKPHLPFFLLQISFYLEKRLHNITHQEIIYSFFLRLRKAQITILKIAENVFLGNDFRNLPFLILNPQLSRVIV